MTEAYELTIPLDPVACPRPKFSKGRTYYPPRYSRWKAAAARMLPGLLQKAGIFKELKCPLVVSLALRVARPKSTILSYPKPDVDNYAKSVLDACNGTAWVDDTQVVRLFVSKDWAPVGEEGSISVKIVPHLPQ